MRTEMEKWNWLKIGIGPRALAVKKEENIVFVYILYVNYSGNVSIFWKSIWVFSDFRKDDKSRKEFIDHLNLTFLATEIDFVIYWRVRISFTVNFKQF